MKKTALLMFILTMAISFSLMTSSAWSATFTIMSEEFAPFNHTENGKFTGLSTEVFREVLKKVGHPDNIKSLPWSRAYSLIQKKENHILFSMTRTEQRENLFKWVGPIADNEVAFFAKKGAGVKISSMEDAKKVMRIGTYKDDSGELLLKSNGFTNLNSVINDDLNLKKLVNNRIGLWISGVAQAHFKAKKWGYEGQIEKVFQIKTTQLYIAFNKNTPDSVIQEWQKALDEFKKEPAYQAIKAKYNL